MLAKHLLTILIVYCVVIPANSAEPKARVDEAITAIEQAVNADSSPGLVVAITDREKVRKIMVHGYADLKTKQLLTAESIFPIGSISKSFTAISLMQLHDQGRFDPGLPIAHYIPEFRLKSKFRPITGKDLLSHTSGMQNYRADLSSSRYTLYALRDFEPSYAPGTHYWYSDLGFQVLGYVLEDITGAPYHNYVQQNLLQPLGMNASYTVIDNALRAKLPASYVKWPYDDTWVESSWFEYAAGDGSIAATVADMSAYARFFLNRGQTPAGRLLSPQSFAQLTTPVLDNYAFGLHVTNKNGDLVIGHAGSIYGFNSQVEAHVQDGFALVFLSNGPLDPDLARFAANALKAACRGNPLPAKPSPHTASATAAQYAGTYHGVGDQLIEFVDIAGTLNLKHGDEMKPLVRMGADSFRMSGNDVGPYPFVFGRASESEDSPVIDVSNGATWYSKVATRSAPGFPSEYVAYVGHYENHNGEGPTVRIFIRGAQLMAQMEGEVSRTGATPLVPVSSSEFRPEEPTYNPERLKFGPVIAKKAIRLMFSGTPLYRLDTP